MSDYKRFVSYIYEYKQGEKGESTGFVKINARGSECKIWIRLRGFYARGQKPYRVYIFTPNRERLLGQFLGELEDQNGALEWNGVTETDSLMGGSFGLTESRGLYIEGEDRIFAAEWDDFPVDVDRFMPIERSARQAVESVDAGADRKYPEEHWQKEAEEPKQPGWEMADEAIEDKAAAEGDDAGASETKEENRNKAAEQAAEDTAVEAVAAARTDTAAEAEPVHAAGLAEQAFAEPERTAKFEERPSIQDNRWPQWEYLANHFPVMRYVDGGGAVISSIRLGSKDLARIPRNKWELGNNSFLLHGFYQYKHILLLRRQTKDNVCYQIGVPGVYNEREQMMASMFGFQEFKVMKGPDVKTGSFGYWCRTLE